MRNAPSCLLVLFTFALTGCSNIQKALGLRVDIAKLPVTSMAVTLQDPGIAPGEKNPLVATFTEANGTVVTTEGRGKGKILWKDISVTATVVTYKKGVLRAPADPRKTDGKTGHIAVTVPSHPTLTQQLDIPLRYNYAFSASYSGASGSNGTNGTNGSDGLSGSPGSLDPDNPSPGGNGGNGTNGTDGGNGGDGGNAPPVQIRMALRAGAHPLLQLVVSASGAKDRFFLVDPSGGSLTIQSEGGSGGSGGSGGKGGSGGAGGIGSPSGSSGMAGSDGRSGSNGFSGNAGPISVTYDPSAQPYLATLTLKNPGGPKPTFTQQTVGPLW
jgi:hypothetical protein